MQIVINDCFGGFDVSKEFCNYYGIPYENKNCDWDKNSRTAYPIDVIQRTDPRLIEYIEKYGSAKASGDFAKLVIKNIPKGNFYCIHDYDGKEWIETTKSIGWEVAT